MDAVCLVQLGLTGNFVEEKRDEQYAVLLRELAIGLAKRGRILGAVVRWRFHARQDDDDVLRASRFDNLSEIVLHLGDRQAAQAIVRAERDNQYTNILLQGPVE